MPQAAYDFAIFGTTPLAGLLAGLLANAHHKRVCLVGAASSGFRLPRGIDLSAVPATRPETWGLLKDNVPETMRLLRALHGRAGMQRIDAIFVAETSESADALAHMRYVAQGFGQTVERLASDSIGGIAYRARDAILLNRAALEPALTSWLNTSEVGQLAARDAAVTIKRDGSVRIEHAGAVIEAQHAVLADDAAILAHLEAAERDRTLLVQPATTLLTEPTRALPSPAMIYVDRDVTLVRNRGGGVTGLGTGRTEDVIARIGGCLAGRGPLRRAGQHAFRSVSTVDGAPLVGVARGLKATVIAGFGPIGAFLAPAIARQLAGVASDSEQAYFAAREAGRGNARTLVAEFLPGSLVEAGR